MTIALHCEIQIVAMLRINILYRVLHIDASGKLTYVPKYQTEYPMIMNYAMKVKDANEFSLPGVVVNETITSRQDTFSILSMLNLFKFNCNLLTSQQKLFQLVMCDMSWATVHASLEAFTQEGIIEYSKRVFNYSSITDAKELVSQKTFVGSCASHTMKRFVNALKKDIKFNKKEHRVLAVCSFSLLLNCTDLKAFDKVIECIFFVFLSNFKSSNFLTSLELLYNLIESRPRLDDNFEKSLKTHMNAIGFADDDNSYTQNNENENESYDDNVETENENTIKAGSPFTTHCKLIYEQVKEAIKNEDTDIAEQNNMRCEKFVQFLLNRFLPYSFIWAGFVFKCLPNNITRLTNGTIENFFRERKSVIKRARRPANNINQVVKIVIGKTLKILDYTESESESETDEDNENKDEQSKVEARDIWARGRMAKKRKSKAKPKQNQKKPFSYQGSQNLRQKGESHAKITKSNPNQAAIK